jgi:hypothetical protein
MWLRRLRYQRLERCRSKPNGRKYLGGRKELWNRADSASSGADAPFPATANKTGAEAADARESATSIDNAPNA